MKIGYYLTLFSLWLSISTSAQSIDPMELFKLNGKWEGTLTYTDYQDDISKSTLGCSMIMEWKNKGGKMTILFTEPNGRVIKDRAKIKVKKDGTMMNFDGNSYRVKSFNKSGKKQGWDLNLEAQSTDNRKQALINQVINLQGNELFFIKLVKYENAKYSFERNRYAFTRSN